MKKVFAIIALMGVFTFGMTQSAYAQDESVDTAAVQVDSAAVDSAAATTEEEVAPAPEVEEAGMYKNIKTKFIEGSAGFMALVAVALILGLAFCIERIIYLSLADVNTKKLLEGIEEKVQKGDIEGAKAIARDERGPVASIAYQGLLRMDQGLDVVERSVVSYGAVQSSYLEKGCSWITLFIAMAPSLGFLGTVIGIVVALILQVFYNYILAKIEGITSKMEDATISLLDIVSKYEAKK